MADEKFEQGQKPTEIKSGHNPGSTPGAKAPNPASDGIEYDPRKDPALATYKAFLEQSQDKKTIENSLFIALCCMFILLFITFPEIASRIIEAIQEQDQITEVPQQKIIEKKEEKPPEVEEKVRQEKREINYSMPSVTAPRASDRIIKVVQRTERLDSRDAALDDIGFDDDIPDTPYIVVAGPIERPEFIPSGPKIYPQRARMLKKNGYASLEVKISSTGETVSVELLEENPADFGFGEAAIKYFEQGRWKPARQNGKPINALFRFRFDYVLQ